MSTLTERMATAPRVPWRAVLILALLLVAFAAAALYVGTQQRRLPAPFGPAANGLIPYVSNGDIYLGDPISGTSRPLVATPEDDALPQFSPDGTRVAFIRSVDPGPNLGPVNVYVVRDDGSDLKQVTPEPIAQWQWVAWTPDGQRLAVIHTVGEVNQLDLFDASGSGSVQRIPAAAGIDSLQFRPPDGGEVLYRALVDGTYGLYAMNADGSAPRNLVESRFDKDMDLDLGGAVYSAVGSRIFYQAAGTAPNPDDGCCRLWVMNADGTDAHEFVPPAGRAWDGQAVVSPDGKWVAYWHVTDAARVAVVRADGSGSVIETGPSLSGTAHWIWSPDSSKILMYPDDGSSTSAYLLDPTGGPWTTVPWQQDGDLDWQRTMP